MDAYRPAATDLRQQIGQGFNLLHHDRLEEAQRLAALLRSAHPKHPEVLYFASQVELVAGAPEAALPLVAAVVAATPAGPGRVPLLAEQVNVLLLLRRRLEARALAAQAEREAGGDARAVYAAGLIHNTCDDPQRARDALERARALGLADPGLLYVLATACMYVGDFDAADAHLETLLRQVPRHGLALHLRSTLRTQKPGSHHVDDLRARLAGGFPDDAARAGALYALAKELEDLGQPGPSFAALTEGAALKRGTLRYDAVSELASIAALRGGWTAEALAGMPPADNPCDAPIFIVGMPRTGTTLVERMLGRHPDVGSAGELLDFSRLVGAGIRQALAADPGMTPAQASLALDFTALGHDYHRGAQEAAPGARRYLDKMPVNFLYCGMIRQALPKARIIHLVRDPMDSCYAIYKTLFNAAYFFSYDQRELADYYAAYWQLMQHWHAVLPPGAILDVRYEDLVSDTETQARRILDHLGLEWRAEVLEPDANDAPATTASSAQVRQPVHTGSVQKWRQYAQGLAPLQARLREHGIPVD